MGLCVKLIFPRTLRGSIRWADHIGMRALVERESRPSIFPLSEQIAPEAFRDRNGSDRRQCSARTIGRLSLQLQGANCSPEGGKQCVVNPFFCRASGPACRMPDVIRETLARGNRAGRPTREKSWAFASNLFFPERYGEASAGPITLACGPWSSENLDPSRQARTAPKAAAEQGFGSPVIRARILLY